MTNLVIISKGGLLVCQFRWNFDEENSFKRSFSCSGIASYSFRITNYNLENTSVIIRLTYIAIPLLLFKSIYLFYLSFIKLMEKMVFKKNYLLHLNNFLRCLRVVEYWETLHDLWQQKPHIFIQYLNSQIYSPIVAHQIAIVIQ